MSNLNCYYAEDCQFDSFFGWLRATQHCACNKCRLLPTCRLLQSTVNLQSQNWTESYSNLQSENWTESWEEFQQKMINSNPNLFKQKWWHPNLSMYWNVARYKCIFISGHFHALGMQKAHFQWNAKREVAITSPRFFNEHHLLHVLFCEGCAWHHLRILVKAPLIEKAEQQVHNASHCRTEQQWRSHVVPILFLLVRGTWVLSFKHIRFVVNRTFTKTERLQHLQQGWVRFLKWLRLKDK